MSRHIYTLPSGETVSTPAPTAKRTPATVRPDWKMPEPPPGGPWRAVVVDTGDGWSPSWESDNDTGCDDNLIVGDAGWPFVEDWAYASDWEALGFEVV